MEAVMRFNAYTCPENVELLPGSKLLRVGRTGTGDGLYLEEELVQEAVELLQAQSREHTQGSRTPRTNTTSQVRP